MYKYCLPLLLVFSLALQAQQGPDLRRQWADSVFQSLTDEERISQLLVIRTSTMGPGGKAVFLDSTTFDWVKNYNVGAVCLFQGDPFQQAALLNKMQAMAKTPVMVTVDGEWGLGMRFAGVESFPYQLTLGALPDAELVYRVGRAIGDQCRRMNIHVNYAPVVDINNNPANPVIGVRSFGEDKYKVALLGRRIMQGMQDQGVMACAKHFPGHGDVSVDSHYDLPVIGKSMDQLSALELYPFKAVFQQGIGSVMVAHLYIPAIDTTANRATSLSPNNINKLLRQDLGYQGLSFTDALEMKGVAKFFPSGEAAVQSLIAGNDMLCLPADVPQTINAVKQAIAAGRLDWATVHAKCRRVLEAKYDYVRPYAGPVSTDKLMSDLNAAVAPLRREVAENALTVVRQPESRKPLKAGQKGVAYVLVGNNPNNEMAVQMKKAMAKVYYLSLKTPAGSKSVDSLLQVIARGKHSQVVVGLHGLGRSPAANFGMGSGAVDFIAKMGETKTANTLMVFGNPYALASFEKTAWPVVATGYEDDSVFNRVGQEWLYGKFDAVGKLPVTVGGWSYGSGFVKQAGPLRATPASVGLRADSLAMIDLVAREAIDSGAAPGCVVAVMHKGKLVFQKAYGHFDYEKTLPMTTETIFDMASVTKTTATTMAVMKLYEEEKLELKKKISDYLPWLKGTDKENLTVENLLLHQAGLVSFIPFYREVMDAAGNPLPAVFSHHRKPGFTTEVTGSLFMNNAWVDTMYRRIATSKLADKELKYVYSDNDFILLGKIVESVSGLPLNDYVYATFYKPLGMTSTGFRVFEHFPNSRIAPTENEKTFRKEQIWGYVHDPGAAMFGNVAGHAGLFSNASDLAVIYQMLLNGGQYGGKRYLKKSTIDWFTSYQAPISRRGLGFDKPEKDNDRYPVEKAYPAKTPSPFTYGHTGFTGTCVWVDPKNDLVYIFLSNRVQPQGGDNRKLLDLNIRGRIHEVIYRSMGK